MSSTPSETLEAAPGRRAVTVAADPAWPPGQPLLAALRDPRTVAALDAAGWARLLRQARRTHLAARLGRRLRAVGVTPPEGPARQLHGAVVLAEKQARDVRWELRCLAGALAGTGVRPLVLKGAAYIAAGLPPGEGRTLGDVDLLVPVAALAGVESALRAEGWDPVKDDAYTDRYYRRWMHEIPPLVHRRRLTVVDVHHSIVPPVAGLRLDPAAILGAARPLPDLPGLLLPCPADLVLHAAVHLFQDGEVAHVLRDLSDIDLLLRGSAADPGFGAELVHRARLLDLERPLFQALRLSRTLFGTPLPPVLAAAAAADQGGRLLLDAVCLRAALPGDPLRPDPAGALAAAAVYLRGHLLRMPLRLLLPHLARKLWQRITGTAPPP